MRAAAAPAQQRLCKFEVQRRVNVRALALEERVRLDLDAQQHAQPAAGRVGRGRGDLQGVAEACMRRKGPHEWSARVPGPPMQTPCSCACGCGPHAHAAPMRVRRPLEEFQKGSSCRTWIVWPESTPAGMSTSMGEFDTPSMPARLIRLVVPRAASCGREQGGSGAVSCCLVIWPLHMAVRGQPRMHFRRHTEQQRNMSCKYNPECRTMKLSWIVVSTIASPLKKAPYWGSSLKICSKIDCMLKGKPPPAPPCAWSMCVGGVSIGGAKAAAHSQYAR